MRFMISIYKMQVDGGRIFLHEHPAHAKPWHMKEVRNLVKEQGVTLPMHVWSQDLGYQQSETDAGEETYQAHDELEGVGYGAGAKV